jgi:hypothetical protein
MLLKRVIKNLLPYFIVKQYQKNQSQTFGRVHPGFPKLFALMLRDLNGTNIFIETGTFRGGTAKWASTEFRMVHTIELSDSLYLSIKDELLSKGNIIPYHGNSRDILPEILKKYTQNIFFWLDGHYSAGDTAGKDDPCPLLQELDIILARDNNDIILIDDARLMGIDGWPSIPDICIKVESISANKKFVQIFDDVIFIVPDKHENKKVISEYFMGYF